MHARILTIADEYCHVGVLNREDDGRERIFVHVSQCRDFLLSDCRVGDVLDLGHLVETERGPRGCAVTFVERPTADRIEGTVTLVKSARGFAFMRPDDGGPDVFLHTKQFIDYRSGASDTFERLVPGMRVVCARTFDQYRANPNGAQIEVTA